MATFFSVLNSLVGRSDLAIFTGLQNFSGTLTVVNDNVAIISPVTPDSSSAVLPLENIHTVSVLNT